MTGSVAMRLSSSQLTKLRLSGLVEFEFACEATKLSHVAERIGTICHSPHFTDVQTLKPQDASRGKASSYSDLHGMGPFPLHTDMAHWRVPPRYLLLRGSGQLNRTPTLVVHKNDVFGGIDEIRTKRALFRPRRRLDGKLNLLRLLEGSLIRWDTSFLVPFNREAISVVELVKDRIKGLRPHEVILASAGQLLLIDNWQCLHGRGAVDAISRSRTIERTYLNAVLDA